LKILQPAVAAASLEDDEKLQEIWANLLANAADPRSPDRVLPSFITILKDLTSWDVKFLDALVRHAERRTTKDKVTKASLEMYRFGPYELQAAAEKLGYPIEELLTDKQKRDEEARAFSLGLDTLNRLGLITRNDSTPQLEDFSSGAVSFTISLSTLCVEFVRVCSKPRASKRQ
jgi:Abortive infection alpha